MQGNFDAVLTKPEADSVYRPIRAPAQNVNSLFFQIRLLPALTSGVF